MSILIISPELWGAIAVIVAALIGAGATIISKGKGEKMNKALKPLNLHI